MTLRERTLPEKTLPEMTLREMTLREMTLREMAWRDIPAVTALESKLFADDAWSEQTWWAELAGRPRRSYVIGHQGGVVVGYAGVDLGGEVADVMTIAVAAAAQGQGLGKVLMQWLIGQARGSGAQHLMLEVRRDNVAAQRLYSAAGFVMLSVRRRYYQPGDVDALIMRLSLADVVEDVDESVAGDAAGNVRGNAAGCVRGDNAGDFRGDADGDVRVDTIEGVTR